MDPLTSRQQEILDYIREYKQQHGYAPLIEEIQQNFALSSVNGVIKHLRALEKKGAISRSSKARGIDLAEEVDVTPSMSFKIPLFSAAIPAGVPASFDDFIEDFITVDHNIVDLQVKAKPQDLFALKVRGDSMIDAGILDGDVVIAQRKEPKLYDVVVALVDNENTLKRLVKENSRYYLKAENSEYPDIIPVEELRIQGVVISMIRHFV